MHFGGEIAQSPCVIFSLLTRLLRDRLLPDGVTTELAEWYSGTSLKQGPWDHENYLVISGFSLYQGRKTKKYNELGTSKITLL